MDNLTHSLVGAALAEAAYQWSKRRSRTPTALKRAPFYFASIFANNFPDADLVMNYFDPTPLGYLLHHRGYTHTLLWAIPQALFVYFLTRILFKSASLRLTLVGVATHMILDYQNSYGIHMFSPFDHHWQYGDSIFIVEPLLWIPILALLWTIPKFKWINSALLIPAIGVHLLGIQMGLMSVPRTILFFVLMIISYFMLTRLKDHLRACASVTLVVLVAALFHIQRVRANDAIRESFQSTLTDLVLSPMPSHPFCWTFFAIQSLDGNYEVNAGIYHTERGTCPMWSRGISLNLPASPRPPTPGIQWVGHYASTIAELFAGYETDCRIRAWYQFARVPSRDGSHLGDLRFGGTKNFSTIDLKSDLKCPRFPVPWIPPFKR